MKLYDRNSENVGPPLTRNATRQSFFERGSHRTMQSEGQWFLSTEELSGDLQVDLSPMDDTVRVLMVNQAYENKVR